MGRATKQLFEGQTFVAHDSPRSALRRCSSNDWSNICPGVLEEHEEHEEEA